MTTGIYARELWRIGKKWVPFIALYYFAGVGFGELVFWPLIGR
jgi:hypothetical protein